MCDLSIMELQGIGIFSRFRQAPFNSYLGLKFLDRGNFPLKTGFLSIQIPLEKGFTLL
jgi:hypothetical protein